MVTTSARARGCLFSTSPFAGSHEGLLRLLPAFQPFCKEVASLQTFRLESVAYILHQAATLQLADNSTGARSCVKLRLLLSGLSDVPRAYPQSKRYANMPIIRWHFHRRNHKSYEATSPPREMACSPQRPVTGLLQTPLPARLLTGGWRTWCGAASCP